MPQKPVKIQDIELYEEIVNRCNALCIARYLKNEVKNILKYIHPKKLLNLKKHLNEFLDYLVLLNRENCNSIEKFSSWKEIEWNLHNSLSYFYDCDNISNQDISLIKVKIERNPYETITLLQSIKWYLILTIDEFCNASPTRIDIMRYNLSKKKEMAAA